MLMLEPPKGDLQQNLEGVLPTWGISLSKAINGFFSHEKDFFKL